MSEDSSSGDRIKVVDRRWFTEDGTPRADRPPVEPKPEPNARPAPAQEVRSTPPRAAAGAAPGGQGVKPEEGQTASTTATSQLFLELVATLAQQAELLLVGGQGLPRQPEQARRLVDYLGVLETKTRGNLSAEEGQILSNVVFQLRTMYLQAGR